MMSYKVIKLQSRDKVASVGNASRLYEYYELILLYDNVPLITFPMRVWNK